ncbi:hypothetical protein O6H91_06G011000 [Diphasiastrum complanatum]|uniref:Uncharacterized protein n=1 Tax=Diphasiastrum complanatum TaxID=34168 RepID=A0ACC2DAX0_DIPCM|nr:hypothetical protein O6H91_06G011000 [Diphasiastrum complanatum]
MKIIVMYTIQHRKYRDGINNLLVLLIGGIPIAMPTVLSVTMAIVSHRLSQQGAITKRMTAIEEMAGMHVLCSDKTGTLTLNLIEEWNKETVFLLAARASRTENEDAIDAAIVGMLADPKEARALFDPPRHDSAETIRQALNLGVNVKMITGDQLAIAKETGRRLGMGTNMYPSSSLLGRQDESIAGLPVDELIEKADGFAGVFPEHKYEIVKRLQKKGHICGMTGHGVNDAHALKKADIGIAVADATDAARSASDIVLTEPGLSVIISAVLTSRAIFQRMKNYTARFASWIVHRHLDNATWHVVAIIYAVSITIRIVLGFMLLTLIWKFDFSPFMILIIAILNDGTMMTISKDRVKPSPLPDGWRLKEIFATGVVMGSYMAVMTVTFYWAIHKTTFFRDKFGVRDIRNHHKEETAAIYLQVSIVSQALIFVTRSRSWSYVERPGTLLLIAFVIAQLVATLIAVYANWNFADIHGIGWGWAGIIWLYIAIFYLPLDLIKFAVRYIFSAKAWDQLFEQKIAFTQQRHYGKGQREAQWAHAQRTLHGLHPPEMATTADKSDFRELSAIAEQAKRRAEIARLREVHTLKWHVESVIRLKG